MVEEKLFTQSLNIRPELIIHSYRMQTPNLYTLRSPEIDSKESISPVYVAWRAGTTTLYLLGS